MYQYNKLNLSNSRRMRRALTPWERKLWLFFLKDFSYHIYKQRPLGNYILDFYCPKARLAIELDGSGHYEETSKVKDEERTKVIQTFNIKVIRFANNDIDRNFQSVCETIKREVEERVKKIVKKRTSSRSLRDNSPTSSHNSKNDGAPTRGTG